MGRRRPTAQGQQEVAFRRSCKPFQMYACYGEDGNANYGISQRASNVHIAAEGAIMHAVGYPKSHRGIQDEPEAHSKEMSAC